MLLPTFIRTGDSYFREKEHYLNTMVSAKGLPTLFVTLSMAESKWIHLNNCPFPVCMYFMQEKPIKPQNRQLRSNQSNKMQA